MIIPIISNYKEPVGPDLTIDLNLVRGDHPQVLNMLAIKIN